MERYGTMTHKIVPLAILVVLAFYVGFSVGIEVGALRVVEL